MSTKGRNHSQPLSRNYKAFHYNSFFTWVTAKCIVCANMRGTNRLSPPCDWQSIKIPNGFYKWYICSTPRKRHEWLRDLHRVDKNLKNEMLKKEKEIASIVDNCPAPPNIAGLKAVELVFLPPNTSSKTQPMNQGIIQRIHSPLQRANPLIRRKFSVFNLQAI